MHILLSLLFLLFVVPAAAQEPPASITARLYTPQTATGNVADVALHIAMPAGWHTYWRSPGAAGLPPTLVWDVQENVAGVQILWPAPSRFSMDGLESFGYKDSVTLPLLVTLQDASKPFQLKGRVDTIICDAICVPASAPIELLPAAGEEDLTAWRTAKDSVPVTTGVTITDVQLSNGVLTLAAEHAPDAMFTDVIIETPDYLQFKTAMAQHDNGRTMFVVPMDNPAEEPLLTGKPLTLTLLGVPDAVEVAAAVGGAPMVITTTATPESAPAAVPITPTEQPHILWVVLLAVLGGLILNLMPCVLPVLSLKLLTIVSHAGETRMRIRRGFMASVAGILVSFWVLALATIILQQTGMALGWGIQFQQPWFLIAMIIIVLAFTANMWGLFEFRAPRWVQNRFGGPESHFSYGKEFATGVFATLLATPCTAPFVGTAIGFALSQGAAQVIVIFTALGFGLALPYLLVALFPAIAQHLPRPGAWMKHVKFVLGLALLATAVWLSAVLLAQTTEPMFSEEQQSTLPWQSFVPREIAGHVAAGKTVFIDLTADWCLTCKVNERVVINSDTVAAALTQPNTVLMLGDWTKPNALIQDYLAQYKRYGIPFNIVFGPGAPDGILLPELLTKDVVLDALQYAR